MTRLKFTLILFLVSLFVSAASSVTYAHNSKAWQERLGRHTAKLWIEGQDIGGIILNARAELNITWLPRSTGRYLDKDRDVDEWVIQSLSYYSSRRPVVQSQLKKRDILVLNYRAIKNWTIDPTQFSINGRFVSPDEILTPKTEWEGTSLEPGSTGRIVLAVPPLKAGQKIEFRYGETTAQFEVPQK